MLVVTLTVVRGFSGRCQCRFTPYSPSQTGGVQRLVAPPLCPCAGTLSPLCPGRLCRAILRSPSSFLAAIGGLLHQGHRALFTEPYPRGQRTNTRDARCTQGATGSAFTRFRGQGLDGWDYGKCSSTQVRRGGPWGLQRSDPKVYVTWRASALNKLFWTEED